MAISIPLETMTEAEKLEAIEIIWADLCRQRSESAVPAWQLEVLRERDASVARGEDAFEDWESAKRALLDELRCE